MSTTIKLPNSIAQRLSSAAQDRRAQELIIADAHRQGHITLSAVQQVLALPTPGAAFEFIAQEKAFFMPKAILKPGTEMPMTDQSTFDISPFMAYIKDFCRRWQVTELSLFGSALRKDFRADSDIDFMVVFAPTVRPTFAGLEQMETELAATFGRAVDIVMKKGIEQSRNYLRRKEILGTAKVIYGSQPPAAA